MKRPGALLLDFGGVCYISTRRDGWQRVVAGAVEEVLGRAHCEAPPRELIERDLGVAAIAENGWKTAASRTAAPAELTAATYWGEFVACDWPAAARASLVSSSKALSRVLVESISTYAVRPGIPELLKEAATKGIPVAIVSNTRSGAAFRDQLARDGLADLIALQVYSDEVGIRKPNPEMLRLAARGLGVSLDACWYCGNHYDRDVMCARRAGVGVAVLVHDHRTSSPPYAAQAEPDVEVVSPLELAELVATLHGTATAKGATGAPRATGAAGTPAAPLAPPRRPAQASRPAALLLDHGGVIVDSRKLPQARVAFAQVVINYLRRTGWNELEVGDVVEALEEARRLHGEMKDPGSTSVPEVSHLEYFRDLVGGRWPDHPRAALAANATPLMIEYVSTRSARTLRPGVMELLADCAAQRIPVGIVSNTLCGAVVRNLSLDFGIAPYLSVEIYSDELGFRKPDPRTLAAATDALGVDPADCWYVGDKPHRDLVCARLAGIGKAVLMRRSDEERVDLDADLIVDSATELHVALESALR